MMILLTIVAALTLTFSGVYFVIYGIWVLKNVIDKINSKTEG